MYANVGVVVGNVKISAVAELRPPAVDTDKCAVTLQIDVEILLRVVVVPAHDDHVVIGLLGADVAVGAVLLVEVHRTALLIFKGRVEGALDASGVVDGLLDGLVVLAGKNLYLLHMLRGRQILRRHPVAVGVLGLQDRPLPRQQVGHGHGVLAAVILIHAKAVADGHVILGEIIGFLRHQAGLQRHQRGEGPAGSQGTLVFHIRCPPLGPVIVGVGQHPLLRAHPRHGEHAALRRPGAAVGQTLLHSLHRHIVIISYFRHPHRQTHGDAVDGHGGLPLLHRHGYGIFFNHQPLVLVAVGRAGECVRQPCHREHQLHLPGHIGGDALHRPAVHLQREGAAVDLVCRHLLPLFPAALHGLMPSHRLRGEQAVISHECHQKQEHNQTYINASSSQFILPVFS